MALQQNLKIHRCKYFFKNTDKRAYKNKLFYN